MSNQLSVAEQAKFEAHVKHAYQETENELRPTVRVVAGITAGTHKFNKMGKKPATRKTAPSVDVVPLNVGHSNQVVTLEDWQAPEYSDIFDQAKTRVQEKKELAHVLAGAINRRERQLIIDALDAAGTGLTVAKSVGGVDTGLNTDKIRRAARLMGDAAVPSKDRHFIASYIGQEQILGETEPTSKDFNTVQALVDGDLKRWVGFQFHWIESAEEGGLDLSGNDRQNFAYHGGLMGAVGMATGKGLDKRTEVNYIPTKTSWLSNCMMSAGATVIDAGGVVEITTHEA